MTKQARALDTPDTYEQVFELNTTGLNEGEIEELRQKARGVASRRLEQLLGSLDPSAWPKYLYYRIKICWCGTRGAPETEEFGRQYTTVREEPVREAGGEKKGGGEY